MTEYVDLPGTGAVPDPDSVFSIAEESYTDYPVEDLSWFDLDSVLDRELIQVGKHKQIWRCETEVADVYLIEALSNKRSSYITDPNSNKEAGTGLFFDEEATVREDCLFLGEEHVNRSMGYEFAKAVGLPIPPHRFGEHSIVSVAGPSRKIVRCSGDLAWIRDFPHDQFLTDIAKTIVIGADDVNPGNILCAPDQEYCFIDVDGGPVRSYGRSLKWHWQASKLVSYSGLDSELTLLISQRANAIGEWILEHGDTLVKDANLQEEFESVVKHNLKYLPLEITGGSLVNQGENPDIGGDCSPWVNVADFVDGF